MYNYQNPYYFNPYQTAPQTFNQQKTEIVKVNGKPGADAYQMAPNSQILLLDGSAPVVWLKTTDGAGYPTVTGYNITPMQTTEQIEQDRYDALEKRIANLEVALNESNTNRSEPVTSKRTSGKSGSNSADV